MWGLGKCLLVAVLASAPLPANAAATADPQILGRRVADFVLPDTAGKQVALSDFNDAKARVVVFLGTQCPVGNAYVPMLNDLQKRYREQGVQVIGVNANLSDTADMIAAHVKEFDVQFPMLVDAKQVVADLFGASRTPEAFLLDRRDAIRYYGRIDDRIGYDHKRAEPRRADLEEAIQELLAGKEVSVKHVEPEGCLITRRDRIENKSEITYARHVSRILQDRCAGCHHPGTAAPFSLLTYEDADQWSETIKETVVQRRMPPWDADPRHGVFRTCT
jgi:peroxiredoxin